ncbi:MAG TPA: long-chain fatty acid--CoA ligase [Povalibacter sp.]|uniref:class I adenylate-forming enzyme family protein n=1 Tax=Povalibacter sp. TaxID=1962978 RepID=UPI002CF86FA7|nr:long-chain fatty acid--CoA ligase [Povalibacter sp.]HMN44115.1 long-chain fatty acid--CoA ligase [Povalibacter sp.]
MAAKSDEAVTSDLRQLTVRALARNASLPAIEYDRRWFPWGELRRVAEQVNRLLDASGVAGRTPIAFVPRNRPSAIAALLGLVAAGRSIRMLYAFQSATALARDVARIRPAVLIGAVEDFSDELRVALRAQGSAAIALQEMAATAVAGFERTARPDDPQAPLQSQIEILTSGTTGPPKQFAVSYDLVAQHLVGRTVMQSGADADLSQTPPTLFFMPLGNISGIYSTLPTLLKGQRAVLIERFNVPAWHDHVLRFRPAVSGLPPAGVQMVLDADIPREDLSSIRVIGTGAAPLDPTVHRAFEERYGIPILLSYGATEFGGPVTAMTADLHAQWGAQKLGSVGRPLPGAQLRVKDPDTDEVLPLGREGILEVISPRIGPHWIRTADIALIDEDGFMFHRGRADGAIMRGGFKLLPETIERALLLHDAIAAAAVVGIDDRRLGQVPATVIECRPGVVPPAIAELEAHLRDQVLATHIPVHWRFVDALPRTPSFKIDRPALRALFET